MDSAQGKINRHDTNDDTSIYTSTAEDKELLALLPEHKEAYQDRLAQMYLERIYRFVAGLVDTKTYKKNDIEDIVSVTFMRFLIMLSHKKDDELKSQPINHYAYLCVIARHAYFDDSNRRRRFPIVQPVSEFAEGEPSSLEETLVDEKANDEQQWRLSLQEVSETIDAMQPPYREVFQLMRDKDLSEVEIAKQLPRNINAVKAQIRRGRAILRKSHPDLFKL